MSYRRRHTPQKILDAALHCVAERGFHGTSMQTICAASGISPGALYRHFDSKDALIVALVEADREHGLELITRTLDGVAGVAALDALVDAAVADLCDVKRNRMRLEISAESARNPAVRAAQARAYGALLDAIADFIADGQRRGEFDTSLPARALAQLLFALADGVGCWRAIEPDGDDAALAAALRHAVRRLLLAPAPPT